MIIIIITPRPRPRHPLTLLPLAVRHIRPQASPGIDRDRLRPLFDGAQTPATLAAAVNVVAEQFSYDHLTGITILRSWRDEVAKNQPPPPPPEPFRPGPMPLSVTPLPHGDASPSASPPPGHPPRYPWSTAPLPTHGV